MENIAVVTLAQSSSQPNVLYAGTGESWSGNLDAIDGSGVFKSSDGGVTWTNVSPLNSSGHIHSDFSSVSRVIVDPSNPDIVIWSAFDFATPAATVPTPTSDTNFTDILALGLTFFKSNIN